MNAAVRWSRLLFCALAVGAGGAACGDITAFCLTAGAPSGTTLVAKATPTPYGYRVVCGPAGADSLRR